MWEVDSIFQVGSWDLMNRDRPTVDGIGSYSRHAR
jgi:hypothetical protein